MFEQPPIMIVVIPLMAAFICPILGLWRKEACYVLTVITLILCAVASLETLGGVFKAGVIRCGLGGWLPPFGIEYVVDHLSAMMLVVISGIGLVVAVYSKESVERELPGRTVYFYTVYLLQVTGFLGIVITGDLFNLYVFLEVASLAGYALIAVGEDGAPMAAFRYILLGTIGACFYLLGIGYLYMTTGSLNMADIHRLLPELYQSKVILTALAFLLVGLSLKMALFPLHMWLPDAYTKAPSAVSALVASLMTKISIYVLIRLLYHLFDPSVTFRLLPLNTIMAWTGVAAIGAGALMALAQKDFKRMLCYIIVGEMGYMVGGLGMANSIAIKGAVLHILNDAVMTAGLFTVAGIITYKTRGHTIAHFKGLFRTMPFTMSAFVIGALSIIGVPPTCGFFSKWYLIQGAVLAGHWAFVVALLVSALVNAILFFRIFEIGYGFRASEGQGGHNHAEGVKVDEAPLSMLLPALAVSVCIVGIGLYNQVILTRIISLAVPGF